MTCGNRIAPLSSFKCGSSTASTMSRAVIYTALNVRQAGTFGAGSGPGLCVLHYELHAFRSTVGLEVIKLAILKATSLMSAVMKSDTFTSIPICKARSTARGPARDTNVVREKHINTVNKTGSFRPKKWLCLF